MNKQAKVKDGVVVGRGIEWCDYTSNPISGCFHACQWTMPDGSVANCYAEDVADRVAQKAYPEGFEHHYWNPAEFENWYKLPAGSKVFVGSMADVFGHWVPEDQIIDTLEAATYHNQATFQFLTKNPKRIVNEFGDYIPRNAWIGASTPPNFMWNKPLNQRQQDRMLETTLDALWELHEHRITTWISAEPLSWDVVANLECQQGLCPIDWLVIGAASNGKKYYPPEESHVRNLVEWADINGVKVFFKGNLKSLKWAADNWREEFPIAKGEVEGI